MTDQTSSEANSNRPLVADPELGLALREALAMPHDGAFVTRLRTLVRRPGERSWDEVLSDWLWHGLVAASFATLVVAAGWAALGEGATPALAEESVAVQLLDGDTPGSEVILASMVVIR